MIPKIKAIKPLDDYILQAVYEDGRNVLYDVKDDISNTPYFEDLASIRGLFERAELDASGTCVTWTDQIDLPSDIIYEYGTEPGGIDALSRGKKEIAAGDFVRREDINWD